MNHKYHFANLKDIWKISTQLPLWSDVMPEWNSEPSQPGWKLPCAFWTRVWFSSRMLLEFCSAVLKRSSSDAAMRQRKMPRKTTTFTTPNPSLSGIKPVSFGKKSFLGRSSHFQSFRFPLARAYWRMLIRNTPPFWSSHHWGKCHAARHSENVNGKWSTLGYPC